MKLVFIDPAGPVKGFNSGLGYLSANLGGIKDVSLKVIDLNNNPYDADRRIAELQEIKADVIGISLKSHTLRPAIALLEKYKLPGALAVAGGPEVTLEKGGLLNDRGILDYCFIGECEKSFPGFVKCLLEGRDVCGVAGLGYRDKTGRVICNEPDTIGNLDELPFPDFSFFDSINYIREKYPLVTSRGCPYKCSYCAVGKVSGIHWRFRSPGHVVEELICAQKNYKIRNFEIVDDNFTMDIARAKEICRLLINKRLSLKWICINGIRADRSDDELFKLMRRAGCQGIWFGIETLNREVFQKVNKGEKIETILQAVTLARKNGIAASGFFIVGLPHSTFKIDTESLALSKELRLREALWSLATPMPRTEMADWVAHNAKILRDYRDASFFKSVRPVFETPDYPARERMKMFYKANIASHCYSIFFSEKIVMADIVKFVGLLLRYDFIHIFCHLATIFFSRSHRKYIKEVLKRIG